MTTEEIQEIIRWLAAKNEEAREARRVAEYNRDFS